MSPRPTNVFGKRSRVPRTSPSTSAPVTLQSSKISSHVLEHFHNPVKALLEWYRIVRPGGIIFMIVPHMERTFDKDRPRTDLAHLIDDFRHDARTPHPDAVQDHDHVWITRANRPVTLLHPHSYSYYDTLRQKLRWGEKL